MHLLAADEVPGVPSRPLSEEFHRELCKLSTLDDLWVVGGIELFASQSPRPRREKHLSGSQEMSVNLTFSVGSTTKGLSSTSACVS